MVYNTMTKVVMDKIELTPSATVLITKIIKEMEQSSEYEYCESQGRIKELDELIDFIENIKKIKP